MKKTVREIRTYRPPDDLVAYSQGNAQFLPEGNVFVNWGQAGAVTEYSPEGDVLFHAYLDSGPNRHVRSYRGFRYPWTGYSPEEPAVLALSDGEGRVSVYVSWNGDTETNAWVFYLVGGDTSAEERYLGKAKRTGFETGFYANVEVSSADALSKELVVAEARDVNGKVLGRSRGAALVDSALYSAHVPVQDRIQWGLEVGQQRLEL